MDEITPGKRYGKRFSALSELTAVLRNFEKSGPNNDVEFYPLVQEFVDSGVDAMFILDCSYPKSSENKWTPSRDDQNCGNIEFVSRGHVEDKYGVQVQGGKGDFTEELCNTIESFVTDINKPKEEGGWVGYTKPRSLLQLLGENKNFLARPSGQFLSKTRKGGKQDIDRFVIEPEHVRKTGKISWHAMHIQGEKARANPAEEPGRERERGFHDEGQAARQVEAQEHSVRGRESPNPMFVGQNENDEEEGAAMGS